LQVRERTETSSCNVRCDIFSAVKPRNVYSRAILTFRNSMFFVIANL